MADITCGKCPAMTNPDTGEKTTSYCYEKNESIWQADEMCARGYILRIVRGMEMIYAIKDDMDKCQAIYDKVMELQKLWELQFSKEGDNGTRQEPDGEVRESDVPF